jgi:hypothetical protein
MAIEAQLFDGTIVEFPDDTDRSVIEKTVKRLTAERQPKEPEEKESVLRQAADIPVNFAKGISQGVRMLSDAFGADNAVSANLRGVEDYLGNLLSAQAKNDQQEIASIFKEAEDKGVLEQVKAGLKAFSVAPVDIMSQAFGTIIPTLAGGLVGRAVGIGARAAGVGTGATMGAGAGKSAIYDAVTEELKQTGLPPEAIQQAATQAQEYGGKNLDLILANTLLGGVAAGTGIERALIPGMVKNISANVAKRGAIGRGLATGAPELLTEGAQGGTEQFSQNVALQREGFDVPTFRGVGTAATMEAVAGGTLGAGIGAFSRPQAATPPDAGLNVPPPQETPTMDMPAIPQPTPSTSMPLLSADEARQQSYEQQTGRQADLQGGLFQPARGVTAPPMAAPPMDLEAAAQQREQAYQQQMAVQNARQEQAERGNQFMTTPDPYLSQAEAAIQPGQTERAQGLAAQQFGLNANAPRQEFAPQFPNLAAAQQSIDGDRFQQQTPLPQVTPAQALPRVGSPTPTPQTARAFDRQAELLGQMQGLPQVEQTGLAAQADIAGRTGQVATPKTGFVALEPMTPREARQKLAVLKEDLKIQEMPAELAQFRKQGLQGPIPKELREPTSSLHIVPHPTVGGRYAIEQRVKPTKEAPEPRRADRAVPSVLQTFNLMERLKNTGVITPEAFAAAQRYGFNINAPIAAFQQKQTAPDIITQQRQGMADEAALNAELRGGVATPEEAQRLFETGMGRPYDAIQQTAPQSRELGLSERERRLNAEEAEAQLKANRDPEAIARRRFQEKLQGPEVDFLEGFDVNMNAEPGPASPEFTEQFMKPEGRYSLSGEATPELKATVEDMRKQLLPILKRFGLGNLGLRLVDSIENGKADGMYAQQVITLALDSDNPLGVMRHEVIHALKELGAFTPAEWKVLTKAAKDTWINQFFDRDMQGRYQAEYLKQNGDLKGFQEYLQEEAIAQAFRFFSSPTPKGALNEFQRPSGRVANLMRRLNEFFKAIRDFFGSKDIPVDEMFLPNRIFSDIERGAIQPGRAQGRKEELPQFAPKYSINFNKTGDLTPLTVQKVRVYEKELEALTKKIGSRIAGMTSDQTVDDVRKAIKKLQSYTAQGLKGREWYERSAKAILDAFNGDPVLAEKLFQIIAITSANTEVAANFTKATNAWSQFANGRPIKVGTTDTNKKIEALLYFGIDWDGRKTNTFYTNLMEAMDGTDSGRSTIDLHMTRMIFGKDTPTDAQYELAENMVRLLASKLDIPPRQIQAASWVTQKAKGMFEDYRKRGIKKDLNDDELRQMTFERAITDYSHLMKAKVQKLRITPELSEPSPSIRARTQTITGEVIPSVKTPMSQVEKVDFTNKEKLTKDIMKSKFIPDIAEILGIDSRIRVTVQSGAYEGKVNPNLKVEIINPNAEIAENDARDLAYAMSYVFKQDATPFFRADPKLLNKAQYGVSMKFGKNLTPAMQKKILGVMNQYLGADAGFSKVGPTEIVMINYRGDDGNPFLMPDVDFIEALAKARDDINQFAPIEDANAFGAKSEYPYHDWEADTDGNAIIKRLQNSRGQRSYLQEQLVNLRESFIGKAREAVIKTGEKPKFSLRNFGSDQSALRPSPSSDAGISFNPVKEDAVSFQGSHYGKAKTEVLNGAKYGQGLKGAEARRLEQSDDDRIKRRVYFYIPRGNNTMPNREAGVGSYVYTQKLDNILAPGPTMGRLNKEAGGDANKFESLIVDNGYDGYAVPDYGMMVVLNQDVPVNYEGTVDEVHGGKKFSLRAPQTPEFKQWFGKSQVVDSGGKPLPLYRGQRRDTGGDDFDLRTRATASFTSNPNVASIYAVKPTGETGRESMVMPVYMRMEKPLDLREYGSDPAPILDLLGDAGIWGRSDNAEIVAIVNDLAQQQYATGFLSSNRDDLDLDDVSTDLSNAVANKNEDRIVEILDATRIDPYALADSKVFIDALKKQGRYDGIIVKDVLTDDLAEKAGTREYDTYRPLNTSQVKSTFNKKPTESPDIRYSLRAPKTPEFKRFFGNSKVVNDDGTPKVMYHGTARIIDEFIPKQANAIFVTDNPDFAESFSDDSLQFMVTEQKKMLGKKFADMSPDDQLQLLKKGYKLGVKQKAIRKVDADKAMAAITEDFDNRKYPTNTEFNNIAEFFEEEIKNKLESGQNIMPLYVRAENPFDYENPRHIAELMKYQNRFDAEEDIPRIEKGNWNVIEAEDIQALIKDLGFDSFYVKEGGTKNLAVYNPNQIKSAIGNRGTYDETGRILYSLKNAPPNQYTKLTEDPLTEKTINGVIKSAFNAVSNDGTSYRNALVDKFSQLSKTLSSLPLFNNKGELRGDMLLHSYAQATNLIKAGLVSGTPILNKDGTIGIERSDNNLANAERLADLLDTNKNVVESGLTGRGYIANIARNLRGADIIAEDRAAQQLGAQQLAKANQMYADLNAEIKTGKLSAGAVAKRQQEINKLRKEGKENSRQKRELQVKPEDIAWAEKQLQMTPEVQDILDIWKEVNTSLVNLYEETGMIDKETADKYRGQKNYVPLFKSREDLNEEAFFRTGTSPKTASKLKELKGADITRNIWENITKQYAVMTAAAYENQTRRVSVEQMRGISGDLAKITTKDDPRVNLRFRKDGEDVHAIIENPNDLAAFQSMTYQFGPVMQFLGGFTKLLRAGALINPMFWLRQLIRDPISVSLTGQAGIVTPFHSAKEFINILARNSEEARVLASRGVIGQFDTTVSLNEFLGNVGKDKQAAPGFMQKSIQRLLEIHEASDAATRVSVYKKAKAKALKDGMSEAQAVDYAVFKARESINFALTGNSPTLAAARQMIPFLNATIVGLDTLYRAATGYGLNAEEKAAAKSAFRNRAAMMVAMSLAYAALMSDDDEYNKLPDYVKDGNWLFPIIGLDGKKTFIKIPVPYEVGYLFKTLPEIAVRYLNGNSTGKEVAKSIRTGLIQNLPTGGTPIPQFAKPALEVVTNYSFYTGRPLESAGDARLPVAERGRKASEVSKALSKAGLDEIGLSPAKIDTLTKGYFAEFGNFFNELADAVLAVGSGKQRTEKDLEDLPFFKSFMADPQADKAVSTFYDHQKTATEVANSFSKMKGEGRVEELQALIADPEKRQMIVAAPAMKKISDVLSTINKQIGIIDRDQSKSPAERRKMINELELKRNEIANRGVEIARQLGL